MTPKCLLLTALLLSTSSVTASAKSLTVQSLLNEGYTVVGVITSPAGPGVFLHKAQSLIVCFVAETPTSPTVATQYCKLVK